jgi:hypothetical protein
MILLLIFSYDIFQAQLDRWFCTEVILCRIRALILRLFLDCEKNIGVDRKQGLLARSDVMLQDTILTKCVGRDLCDRNGMSLLHKGKTAETRLAAWTETEGDQVAK